VDFRIYSLKETVTDTAGGYGWIKTAGSLKQVFGWFFNMKRVFLVLMIGLFTVAESESKR